MHYTEKKSETRLKCFSYSNVYSIASFMLFEMTESSAFPITFKDTYCSQKSKLIVLKHVASSPDMILA